MIQRPFLVLVAISMLFLAACSDDDSPVADAAADSDATGDAAQDAGQDVGGGSGEGGDDGGGDTTINIGDGDSSDQADSEKLPGWAIALLVAVAVLAVVGVVLGYQNRSAQKTQQASEEAYRQGRQDGSGAAG